MLFFIEISIEFLADARSSSRAKEEEINEKKLEVFPFIK